MLALAKLPHSGAVAVVRQLRRPSLKRRQTKLPLRRSNQKSRTGRHNAYLSKMGHLPMPTYTASKTTTAHG